MQNLKITAGEMLIEFGDFALLLDDISKITNLSATGLNNYAQRSAEAGKAITELALARNEEIGVLERYRILLFGLTDAQREEAKQAFRDSIEGKIGVVRKSAAEQKPTESERSMKDLTSSIDQFVASGNPTFLNTVLKQAGYIGSESTEEGLFLLKPDGGKTKVDINTGMSAEQIGRELSSKIGIQGYDKYSEVKGGEPSDAIYSSEIYSTFETAPTTTMSSKDEQAYAGMFKFIDRDGMPLEEEALNQAKQSALGGFKDYLTKVGMNPSGLSMDETGEVTYGNQSLGNITDGFYNLKSNLTSEGTQPASTNRAPR
jgi:hypothetical protein